MPSYVGTIKVFLPDVIGETHAQVLTKEMATHIFEKYKKASLREEPAVTIVSNK